jgi:hypothetical protein
VSPLAEWLPSARFISANGHTAGHASYRETFSSALAVRSALPCLAWRSL